MTNSSSNIINQLCAQCGLCCNGALFSDVRLQKGDDPARLRQLGIRLERTGRNWRFSQPCSCLNGNLCQIYRERPVRCRTFECRVLQRAQEEQLTVAAALRIINKAKKLAARLERILRALGQEEAALPLTRRCAMAIAAPLELSGDARIVRLRGQLLLAIHELMQCLEQEFF
jgi:uncharacterized protein